MDNELRTKLYEIAQNLVKVTSEHSNRKDISGFIRDLFGNMTTICSHIGREMDYLRTIERAEKKK